MNLSIGEIIERDIKKSGMSVTFVAQQINMSRKGLSDMLKRNDMGLSQLAALSQVMGKDYFELYKLKVRKERGFDFPITNEPVVEYVKTESKDVHFNLSITGSLDVMRTAIPELLDIISAEAEARGLQLG